MNVKADRTERIKESEAQSEQALNTVSALETRYGALKVLNVETDLVARFLDHLGEWAWIEVSFVNSVLSAGSRVLDVGAYLGTFGLGLAQQGRVGFLCAAEANPKVVPLLKNNLKSNCPVSYKLVGALITGSKASVRVGYAENGNIGSTSYAKTMIGSEVGKPTRALSLSELRAEYGPFDLIKLDVEGMELEILRGDAEYISRRETTLWMECNDDEQSLQIAEVVLSLGLEVYYFAFPAYNKNNFRKAPNFVFPCAFEAGLLVNPKVPPRLDEDLSAQNCILRSISELNDLKLAMWHTPRWGLPEWHGLPAPEVVALAGHFLCGDTFDKYLTADWRPGPILTVRLQEAHEQIDLLTENVQRVSDELAHETEKLTRVESGLRYAEKLAFERLATINEELERRERAESALHSTVQEINRERERRADLEAELLNKSSELKSEQLRNVELAAAAGALRHELKQAGGRADAAELTLASTTDDLLRQIRQLGAARRHAEQAYARTEDARANAEAMLDSALRQVSDLTQAQGDAEQALGDFAKRNFELEEAATAASDYVRSLASTVAQQASRMDELEATVASRIQHIEVLTTAIRDRDKRIAALETNTATQAEHVRTLTSAADEQAQRIRQLENDAVRQRAKFEGEVWQFQDRVLQLSTQLSDSSKAIGLMTLRYSVGTREARSPKRLLAQRIASRLRKVPIAT